MSTLVAISDFGVSVDGNDRLYSPVKEKAANRGAYINRSPLSLRRAKHLLGAAKTKLFLGFCALSIAVVVTSRINSWMGWNPHYPSSVSSPSKQDTSVSNLKGHSDSRSKCLNDLISLYGTVPLVPTNVKAVSARNEWLW